MASALAGELRGAADASLGSQPTIFVSIPSYRDPECQYTVLDLFQKAKHPERVRVGICWQADREDDAHCFLLDLGEYADRVRTHFLHHSKARGPCYARALIQSELFQDEDYYFQLDSHYRMIKDWDEELITQLGWCPSEKPILTTYPSSYTLPDDYKPGGPDRAQLHPNKHPVIICAREFGAADGFLRTTGKVARAEALGGSPHEGLFWAAGFAFSSAAVVREVPYDIGLEDLFFGEEPSMAARLWTAGWDFYAPTKVIGYHLWTRRHRPIFREHASDDQRQREARSRARVRQLIGDEGAASADGSGAVGAGAGAGEAESLGLGAARPLSGWEAFCGVKPATRKISLRARRGGLRASAFLDGDPAAAAEASAAYPSAASSGGAAAGAAAAAAANAVPMLGLMPGNISAVIQALAGALPPAPQDPASASAAAAGPGPPPQLLQLGDQPSARPRFLFRTDVETLQRCGFVVIDNFLRLRGYAQTCGPDRAADAPRIVRRGAEQVPMRPAGLGRGERLWKSSAVRGDEMTWLSAPQGEGLRERAERRVREGLGGSPATASVGATSEGADAGVANGIGAARGADADRAGAGEGGGDSEFDALHKLLRTSYAADAPAASAASPAPVDGGGGSAPEAEANTVGNDASFYKDLDVYLAKIVELREEMDSMLSFGSTRTSLMLARYPGGGARYARHLDASPEHTGARRRLTAVYYLNSDWKEEDGGCLRVYLPEEVGLQVPGAVAPPRGDDNTDGGGAGAAPAGLWTLDIEPRMDRMVLFASGWLEHEVLPSHAERYAITAWFY